MAVDIRMTNNEGVLERIREKVADLLQREDVGKQLTAEELAGACSCSQTPADAH